MELNLIDKLTLLALDDEKGSFISSPLYFTYGIAGAILLELTFQNKIEILEKKVIVKSRTKLNTPLLNQFLEMIIQSKKDRTLKYWLQKFGNKERDIKKQTLAKLISKGILIEKEKKFLWVIPNNKYPAINSSQENKLRRHLTAIVEFSKTPELEDIMLLSLIDASNLTRGVFGKAKAKLYKKNIKTLVESAMSSKAVGSTVKEVHDLVVAMLVVLMSTTVVVTTAS